LTSYTHIFDYVIIRDKKENNMKYASADFDASKVDYNYVGQQVSSLSSIFEDVFNAIGYAGAASFVNNLTP
jgi:hypothetical protein